MEQTRVDAELSDNVTVTTLVGIFLEFKESIKKLKTLINQLNFYSANIPVVARLSGALANQVPNMILHTNRP